MPTIEFENYHSHSCISNGSSLADSPVLYDQYAKVYKERGMHCLFAVEHGNRGDVFRCYSLTEQYAEQSEPYKLTTLAGAEAYFVNDRKAKDRTNAHLILIAKDQEGYYELNEILSESYETGKYHKNRIDWELLERLDPSHFVCTTACVAGPVGKMDESAVCRLASIFGKNFYLEVQAHLQADQIEHNKKVLYLYHKYGYPLIFATDSHYIDSKDKILRDQILLSSHITYEDEGSFDLFLPTAEEAYELMKTQGVLSEAQIREAFDNTLQFRDYPGVTFTHEKKIPNIYPKLSQEQRDKMYWTMCHEKYEELYGDTPDEQKLAEYEDLENNELHPVIETHTTDYFLDVKATIDKGIKYGGILTHTGRGSGVSFASNHLLGFTSINRLRCPVTLYPERFISAERLKAGSIPDLDLNIVAQEPFQRAGREIFGEFSFLPMIKYDTNKAGAAFKMLARANDIPFETANLVSKQLKRYDTELAYADEDEKDMIQLEDYVEPRFLDLVKESEAYRGIIMRFGVHPCAHLMVQGDIRRLFGTIIIDSEHSKKDPVRCAYITGDMADKFGFVKQDLLIVECVKLAEMAYEAAGIEMPTVDKLIEITKNDKPTWDIYAKGLTLGVNQVEKQKTSDRVKQFKPKSVSEISAFIAAIRPGFKTMLNSFVAREPFTYNIPILDNILQTKDMPSSWLLYQEHIMTIAKVAGLTPAEAYVLIKAISKKKKKVIEEKKEKFINGLTEVLCSQTHDSVEKNKDISMQVWQIVEDSASYMFNASHSFSVACDSLYAAYVKAHYPIEFYKTLITLYADKGKKDKIAEARTEALKGFGIRFVPPRFRQDNRTFSINKEENTISDVLVSAKSMGKQAASDLLRYKDYDGKYFVDLAYDISKNTSISKTMMEILIKMDYFQEFGSAGKLMGLWQELREGKNKLNDKLIEKTFNARLEVLHEMEDKMPESELPMGFRIRFEIETFGTPISTFPDARGMYAVTSIDDKYGIKLGLYNLRTGTAGIVKVKKPIFTAHPLYVGDVLHLDLWLPQPAYTYKDGKRQKIEGSKELWIEQYTVLTDPVSGVKEE